jgi:mRNA interferase HigB
VGGVPLESLCSGRITRIISRSFSEFFVHAGEPVPKKGTSVLTSARQPGIKKAMRIISKKRLKEYGGKPPAAKTALEAWHTEARAAEWSSPAEVKAQYGTASILKDGRVVFNLGGNQYRLVVWINYEFFTIYVRFIGTHKEYDDIDAQTI